MKTKLIICILALVMATSAFAMSACASSEYDGTYEAEGASISTTLTLKGSKATLNLAGFETEYKIAWDGAEFTLSASGTDVYTGEVDGDILTLYVFGISSGTEYTKQ